MKCKRKTLRLQKSLKSLYHIKVKVHQIKVFGSRARGEATEASDLDVLIIAEALDHSLEKYISDCAWEAGFPDDVVIMPIAITLDALEHSAIRGSVFIKNVYREGVNI